MPNLETLSDDEKSDEESNEEDIEIPDGLPGSKKPRPAKIERISIPNIGIKRRGRPPGSGNSTSRKTKENTQPELFWVEIAAFANGLATAFFAAKVMRDRKYCMTRQETEAAGHGIITVAWQYKQFREFASIVNSNSPYAILARGYWPYISRAFVGDMLQNVIAGLFVRPDTGQQSKQSTTGNERNDGGFVKRNDGGRTNGISDQSINVPLNVTTDWRDV